MSPELTARTVALVVLGVGMNAAAAAAQVSVGLQADWGSDADIGLGVHAAFDLGGIVRGLETVESVHYFFPSARAGAETAYRELNANLVYRINRQDQTVIPYVGTGLNISYYRASVQVLDIEASGNEILNGLNLLGGLTFHMGRFGPFVEGRVTTGGGTRFVASAGLRF